jgi:hypothetical protein
MQYSQKGGEVKSKYKPLIIGVATLGAFDLAGLITMVADPDLTARVIPALVGMQILGFIAIAAILVTSRRENISAGIEREPGGPGRQWVPWLFGFLALVSFLRTGLSILYIAGEAWHKYSWVAPTAGAVMGCFFLWLAVLASRTSSKRGSRGRTSDTSLGL